MMMSYDADIDLREGCCENTTQRHENVHITNCSSGMHLERSNHRTLSLGPK